MEELVKAFRDFLTRDLLYILGGGCVLFAFLYCFDRLPRTDLPTPVYALGAALAYVVGWAVQDGLSLLPIASTQNKSLGQIARWLYSRFRHKAWEQVDPAEYDRANALVDSRIADISPRSLARLERQITQKHIGMTMGTAGLVSAPLLFARACQSREIFDLALGGAALIMACVFLALGWVKRAQQTEITMRLARELEQPKTLLQRPGSADRR